MSFFFFDQACKLAIRESIEKDIQKERQREGNPEADMVRNNKKEYSFLLCFQTLLLSRVRKFLAKCYISFSDIFDEQMF